MAIEWNPLTGKAYEVKVVKSACEDHVESYKDEYGMWKSCCRCQGSGTKYRTIYVRTPEYDAPTPSTRESEV